MKRKKNPHLGSSFDSFLKEEGIYDEVKVSVMKQVVAERVKNKNLHNRKDWEEKFKKMANSGDDKLLDPMVFDLEFDKQDWIW